LIDRGSVLQKEKGPKWFKEWKALVEEEGLTKKVKVA
jgi:hypothetical protein